VGSSFDFVNGDRARAPVWVRRLCLEWAWRLGSQPWHWRRYLLYGMPVVARMCASALCVRLRGGKGPTGPGAAPPTAGAKAAPTRHQR
jgi:N-acetylglucosaminyldiphosphoundecaprenol N-acetyl-beta-D-mannosaminyltransferase